MSQVIHYKLNSVEELKTALDCLLEKGFVVIEKGIEPIPDEILGFFEGVSLCQVFFVLKREDELVVLSSGTTKKEAQEVFGNLPEVKISVI